MALIPEGRDLARLTMQDLARHIEAGKVVVMVPVGAVEPHGPHLALYTDIVISQAAAARAADLLEADGVTAFVAPAVPYGVTRCAATFKGAIGASPEAVTAYLASIADGFLANGVAHVCFVNNHLEPEHIEAVQAAAKKALGKVSVACPVKGRWARTLDEEFKSGACHAGSYETSIVMASAPELVREDVRRSLPEVPISLSEQLAAGVTDFAAMGLRDAYAGTPAAADAAHGSAQLDKLAVMIATEIREAMAGASP